MEFISTIISILAMLGLTDMQNKIKQKYASKEGVSEDDILKAINAINNDTRNLNDKTLSVINNKLSAVTFPAGMSENVKEHLYNVRNNLSKKQQNLSNKINEVERNINSIDERARVYMSLDPDTRRSNKNTILELVNDAAKQNVIAGGKINEANPVSNFTKRIEDSINNDKTVFEKLTDPAKQINKKISI